MEEQKTTLKLEEAAMGREVLARTQFPPTTNQFRQSVKELQNVAYLICLPAG